MSDPALRRARVTAIVLAASMFMVGIDSTVLVTALPRMARDFGVAPTSLSTTITIYILVSAALLPVSSWIGQRLGSRRVFTVAMLGFTLSSVGCGLAGSLPMFLLMRVCQAAFGTLMVPVGNIVLLTITPKRYLVTAMAISSTPALLAPVIGPPLGGFITTYLDWPWVFFINLPIGAIGLVAAARFIPDIAATERTPFDWPGFGLTASFLCALIAGLDRVSHKGEGREIGVLLLIAAAILGTFALRHARSARHPIVPLTPLRYQSFFISTIGAGTLTRIAFMGLGFTLPLMFQIGFGLSPFHSGLLLLAQNAGDVVLKSIAPRTLRHFGFRKVLVSGSLMIAASILVCAMLTSRLPFPILFAIMFAVGMARSVHMTGMMALRFADMPHSEVGGATVLGNLVQSLTQAFAISGVAALLGLLSGGADVPTMAAFRITVLILACSAACATPLFLRLSKDAGAEVTGRVQRGLKEMREESEVV
ncbi:MFS transporter [Sphingobium sp. H33]|uniref:MFS transporter n=2 Tax=Sphingobium nicotianae TaxID=2782607 RepID=A0A9X1IPY5_9SPHN|nr:MFS transporter [Sphingobium nicotianae]